MSWIVMSKPGCNYCTKAKELLRSFKYPFSETIHDTQEKVDRFKANGYKTFPQVFHDGVLIGGYTDLCDYLE